MINVDEAIGLFDRPIARQLETRIKKALKNGAEKIFWYTDSEIIAGIVTNNLTEGNWLFKKANLDGDIIIKILVKKSLSKKVKNENI